MVAVTFFLALVFVVSVVKRRMATGFVTAPMVFAAAGLVLYFSRRSVLDQFPEWNGYDTADPVFLVIAEVTLVIILFSEAGHSRLDGDGAEDRLTLRLLFIALPLAVLGGALTAMGVFAGMGLWTALVLATILAPTDASLGLAVVQSKRVPVVIRQTLMQEGGLNDGLAVPLLLLFIALSTSDSPGGADHWIRFALEQIGIGLLVGVAVGWVGGRSIATAVRRRWTDSRSQQLALLSIGLLAWAIAEYGLDGNGFIAAFYAGVGLKFAYRSAPDDQPELDESWIDLLVYFVFFYFGISVGPALDDLSFEFWVYAVLSLTIIRSLAVLVSFTGAGLRPVSTIFIGWFGPRGLASIILVLIYLEELDHLDLAADSDVILAAGATIAMSIVAHGVSANPGIRLYHRQLNDLTADDLEYDASSNPHPAS
jgi:NhaP-type Na+/H+ or K+/H+ antiporter